MTPALARIKRAVREAVSRCGGVDGAGATAGRCRSVAGDWNNLNAPAFPPLDCALALDEVAIATQRPPAILSALAAELGHACFRLPDAGIGGDALTGAMIEASAEFGDIAAEIRDATRDGAVSERERQAITAQVDEAMAALARLRALCAGPFGMARDERSFGAAQDKRG